jgi:hypothetical protein
MCVVYEQFATNSDSLSEELNTAENKIGLLVRLEIDNSPALHNEPRIVLVVEPKGLAP